MNWGDKGTVVREIKLKIWRSRVVENGSIKKMQAETETYKNEELGCTFISKTSLLSKVDTVAIAVWHYGSLNI